MTAPRTWYGRLLVGTVIGLGLSAPFLGPRVFGGGGSGPSTPTYVQSVDCNAVLAVSHQCIITGVAAGDALVWGAGWTSSGRTIVSLTDTKGQTWTVRQTSNASQNNGAKTALATAINVAAGTDTVTVTYDAATATSGVVLAEYSGVDQTTGYDVGDTGTVASAASKTTAAATTTQNNDRIIVMSFSEVAARPLSTPTATNMAASVLRQIPTGFTGQVAFFDSLQTTAGATTVTQAVTGGNSSIDVAWIALLPGTGGGGGGGGGGGVVDAAQSTVTASSPVAPGALSTVTITAKTSAGAPIAGVTATYTVSGSGNTVNQPSLTTNGSGVTTGTFSSTVSEVKTVVVTAGGVVLNQQPTVTVSGSGTSAWLLEDFSTYTSTANMLSDPRGIYSTTEDLLTSQMVLDQTVGYSGLTQSMRYDMQDQTGAGGSGTTGRCGSYTIGRNLTLPAHATEIWVEVDTKTSPTFTTVAPGNWGCTSAAAYKMVFGRTDVSRFNIVPGIFGTSYTWGYPGNEEPADYALTWLPFDGNWHQYRMYMKLGSAGQAAAILMVDGTVVKSFTGVTASASYLYGIALGRNMNQGPPQNQSIWWGKVAVYNINPSWGIP